MKKHLIIITLALTALLMSSCTNLRFALKNKDIYNAAYTSKGKPHETINFEIKHDRILAETTINGKPDTVYVDTGFNGELLQTHTMSDLTPKYMKVAVAGAHKISRIYESVDTVRYSFLWDHLGVKMNLCLDMNLVCGKFFSTYPLLGFKAMFPDNEKDRMNLNFSEGKIKYFTNDSTKFDLTGYKPIKCKYSWLTHRLFVYVRINGLEYKCLFDTGNVGYMSIKKNKEKNLRYKRNARKKDGDIVCEGSWGVAISGVEDDGEFIIRNNENVQLGDDEFKATVCYSNSINDHNMGLKFISRFDWYMENGQLYYKPRNVENPEYQVESPYRILATDKGLMVTMRVKEKKYFLKFGDIITSVNGEKITSENICHYYELLNKTKDWSELVLVVSR